LTPGFMSRILPIGKKRTKMVATGVPRLVQG
jgi:hypothetical protein